MDDVLVRWVGDHPTISLAAHELAGYLERMAGSPVSTIHEDRYSPGSPPSIWLGLVGDLPGVDCPAVTEPDLDDVIAIDVHGREGVIGGANPRSVLLGVYRYLTELGCRWVRPGHDGEIVPRVEMDGTAVRVRETRSHRHRMLLFDGAISWEHLRDSIEWAPRLGFNSFLLQFRDGYPFFDRWYSATREPGQPSAFSPAEALELYERAAEEIKSRDLVLHWVGHTWTCEPLGLPFLNYDTPPPDVPAAVAQYMAEIDGKRGLWYGNALHTNLCYSNPGARRLVVEDVVRFARRYPAVDFIHVWLADGLNNHCECAECRQARPADWYVLLLNEIDDALTEARLGTRIAFIAYVDILWPPESQRIRNPNRFVFVFAAINRTHSRPFGAVKELPELAPYERNRLEPPRSPEGNEAHLRAWQSVYSGDSCLYDYHCWRDQYHDPAGDSVATVLHEDIRQLRRLGFNGLASCQTPRAYFPTGLAMTVMGRTLWNRDAGFEEIASDYFAAAFGPDGVLCRDYLHRLSQLFDPPYLREERAVVDHAAADRFSTIPGVVDAFRPVIERNLGLADGVQRASWRYIRHHADVCHGLAGALEARARGDKTAATERWHEVRSMVREREPQLQSVFDVFLFVDQMDHRIPRLYEPQDAWFWRGDIEE